MSTRTREAAIRTQTTFCRICESLCGLEATLDGDRVVSIRADEAHVATGGFSCPKGIHQHEMYASPDRLLAPERRVGDRWERVGWDEAIGAIGRKVRQLRADHGPDSIAMYVGTAAGFGVLHPVFAQGFMTGLGSRSMYSSSTQDCANKFAVAREMYGFPFTQPFPDLDRTRCLVIVGANPVISKWSFLQVPNPARALQEIEQRGGKVWVVDPRRTETARAAGEHVFIRPDTDVFFYLSFLRELLAGGIDEARVAKVARGLDAIRALCEPWTPERTAEVTRIPPGKLREMVESFRTADGAALYSSTGVNMGSNGSLAFWLQEVANLVSGNLDRPGGTLVGHGVIDFAAFGKKTGTLMRRDRSRVGDFGSVNDGFPGGILADEILTPGDRQVRALFVTGGNPLITMANSGRLREAFGKLELLVTLDLFRNETGSVAHYVLPCTSPLERPDLPFVFPLMLGLQRRPYLQATEALLPPPGEVRDEATIYLDLCRASGVNLFGSAVAQRALQLMKGVASRRGRQPALPQRLLLSGILRATGQGSFGALLREPHGRLRGEHVAGDFLGTRVVTDDRLVDLAPAALVAQAGKLEGDFERERSRPGQVKLITKRAVGTHNSWTHNIPAFAAPGTNWLYVHPEDARRIGLSDGDMADVSTPTATVRLPVKLLADLMPGTVALPHGWGHQHAAGLSIASRTRGVNVNLLAADGPDALERVSGMAHLTGFPVEVRPAAGPQDPRNWSGISPQSNS
ncbi:MAG TPA: molybdopterin-dependent oxidoreductase [Anaeromyxobacteraceae bacterium]|nr:molybdopterin-dependent oxidoreductase [Anaeromyxobacteraceae bacterium]